MTTARHVERDHRARRRQRHPALPRLPDRAAGRAVDLPRGRLPPDPRRAARPRSSSSAWIHDITYHTFIHENMRKRFLEGFHYDAHPMGMLVSADRRAVDLLPRRQGHPRPRRSATSRSSGSSPRCRRSPPRATASASGMPFVYPDNSLELHRELPVDDVEGRPSRRYDANPALAQALDVLFILHADHEQNCGTTAMRTVGSAHADPYVAHGRGRRRPLRPAPRRRQRGGHPHAHRDRLDRQRRRLRRGGEGRARAGSRASATASTRTTTRGRRSSSRPPTRSSRSPARTRCSTSR